MRQSMKNIPRKLKSATQKSIGSIRADGPVGFVKRSARYVYYRQYPDRKPKVYKDILFINGCTLEAPTWYRVNHQMEQLEANGLSTDTVFYDVLTLDMLKYYRGFVFFRCPVTDTVREFIKIAKYYNKRCFFDVDDLVIDQKYTDQIEFVANMAPADKAHYDDGVNRMQETLRLCDHAITTTEALQKELSHYLDGEVYINRNVASDEIQSYSQKALQTVIKDPHKVIIGYFSGSITHNEDFEMVMPSLIKILQKHPHVFLKVTGIITILPELEEFRERIIGGGFYNQREFPAVIADCDIAIAPLTDSIFNAAKSENKWLLPALVKVPTVASRIGAFIESVDDGKTGILVDDSEWFDALDKLVADKSYRERIGMAAYKKVTADYITVYSGYGIAEFIRSKLARNIAFVLPSTDISGGVNVALKHADILRRAGWDVTLMDGVSKYALKLAQKSYRYRHELDGFNVVPLYKTKIKAFFDSYVATLWSTLALVKSYPNVLNRLYLVQNFETDFYEPGSGKMKFRANASYADQTGIKYITISLWCQRWLQDMFAQKSAYASNGIDLEYYPYKERHFEGNSRIKLLVEGDSKSEYKNTDEAFRIIEKLDPKKYEVSYLSYRKEPKPWYRVDHYYNRVPPEKVGEVYASCDILIKTSLLESFSYPPLEMMATGGLSVVLPNGGNVEYLKNGENCIFYRQGDIDDGVQKVEQLVSDKSLRDKLIANGLKTAKRYAWDNVEPDILALYE